MIGWQKIYHFKGAKESKTMDNRVFSIAQISIADSFANWMQASYIPKAGIGDVRKSIFPKINLYRPYEVALPQGYGATAYTWNVSWQDGQLKPIQETEDFWNVLANSVPTDWAIRAICSNTHFYFTMPSFDNSDDQFKKQQDLSGIKNLQPYIYFWLRNVETGGGSENILLCKDNKSPFIKITKGEYLGLIETGITKAYEEERKKIYKDNQGNQKNIDYFMGYLEEKNRKRITCLKNNQEKYRNRLQETATVFTCQPDIMLENYPDVFEGNGNSATKIPVYTLDPSMYELCKQDHPQWIRINWEWGASDVKTKHMHESIINNFNFEYVYNFFFTPEKNKGMAYQPKRSPSYQPAIVTTAISETAKKAGADKNSFFFEDFSANAEGQKPIGWYAKMSSNGVDASVTTIKDKPGKWVILKGNSLFSNTLKKPLPQDFTLSYDVMVPKGFTWGGKGLEMIIAREKTTTVNDAFIRVKVRPGSDGREGSSELEIKSAPGYLNETKYGELSGFSNDKNFNSITIRITKKGEKLTVFADQNIIGEYNKAMPADIQFTTVSFFHTRSDSETEKYYISNIKIIKE